MSWLLRMLGGRFKTPLRLVNYDARFAISPITKLSDSKAMRVGNRDSLGAMERLDRLENDLRAQKQMLSQIVDELGAHKQMISQNENRLRMQEQIIGQSVNGLWLQKRICCSVRATEIERNGHHQTEEAEFACLGGDIATDLEVLKFLKKETPERYDFTREAFEAWYEVSLKYRDHIAQAPELIVSTFNTLANTKSLYRWLKIRKSQEEAKDICRGIISKWLEYIDAGEGEYPGDDIRREFEKLAGLK